MPARAAGHPPKKTRRLAPTMVAASAAAALPLIVWWALPPQSPPPLPPAPLAAAPHPARAPSPTATRPADPTADAAAPRLAPEWEAQVRALTITARRTGDGARIVIDGKVFEPGAVILADVVLDAVLPDRVVFRNARDQRFELRL